MRPPRLVDVAAQAGVSEATVSRVLNDKPNVSPTTRQAVLTALDVLGYERPPQLQRNAVGLVGLIVPELDNPVFPLIAQVVETALAVQGYTAVLCTQTPGGVHEDEYTRMLLDRGVAGIVFVSGLHADTTMAPARYTRLLDRGLPVVLVNGHHRGIPAPCVSTDDAAAVDVALDHLVSLGHTRIGLAIGPDRFVPSARKIAAFRAGMAARVGDDDPHVECTTYTVQGGASAATRLLTRGCTAIVCGSDVMALGAIRAVRATGRSVPGDVSVVGSDDSPLMEYTDPPLTTVRQPVTAIGEAAVQALLDVVAGRDVPPVETLFRPELVIRRSTSVAPR